MNFARFRFLLASSLAGLALLLAGCASTTIKKTWTGPGAGLRQYNKAFILALTPNDLNRHMAESSVRTQIERMSAVTSFEVLPSVTDIKDKDKLYAAIRQSQADLLIVLKLKSTDYGVTYGPTGNLPMDYQIFSGFCGDYYGTAHATVYDVSAYFSQERRSIYADRVFSIESSIFDVKTEKLIWLGLTETKRDQTRDHDVVGIITEVAKTIKAELKSRNLSDQSTAAQP